MFLGYAVDMLSLSGVSSMVEAATKKCKFARVKTYLINRMFETQIQVW